MVDVNTAVSLTGQLVHTPSSSVLVTASTPLSQYACTGVYQTGTLSTVTVTLTDGSTRTGTPSLSSGNTAVATVSGTTVTALTSGNSVITATYATASGNFTAYVSAAGVSVTAMSLTYASSTLTGQTGTTSAGTLSVTFSDGTSFPNVIASPPFPLSTLIGFNSSDPAFVTVSPSGVAGLVNNSWRFAVLTAFSQCGDGRTSSFSMAGNLAASYPDTKLGATSGLTFPAASNGGTVTTNVQVQVSGSPLTTYQMWLFYNNAVFGNPTITKGSGWSVGSFASSVGTQVNGNIYKAILSFSSGSSATNTLVLMATVSFPVITSSPVLELITANVLTFTVASGNVFQSASGTQIVAGTGYVSLNGGYLPQFRRRNLLSAESDDGASRRLLQTGLPFVTGDCNGDGLFNAGDATQAQTYVTNGAGSWPTSSISQMRNCAPSYSYMFNNIQSSYTSSQMQV